jgi:hypothetical protein
MPISFGKYGRIAALCLLLAPGFPGQAQEDRIYSAEGGDFVLARGETRIDHQPESLGPGGFILRDGDVLQTGPGTFVEIRLASRNVRVKTAGSTTLTYRLTGRDLSLDIDYGRILLAEEPAGAATDATDAADAADAAPVRAVGSPVFIRGGAAEVIFRQGAMAVDYMVLAEESLFQREPVFRAGVFSGTADLISHRGEAAVPVNPMEMAVLDMDSSLSRVERRPLSQDIIQYWDRHKPAGLSLLAPEPPPPAPAEELAQAVGEVLAAEAPPPERPPLIPADYNPFFKTNKIKNGFIVGGATLFLLGAGVETLAWYMNFGNRGVNDTLMYTGYGFFGLGFLSLGAGLSFNPRMPESNGAK